MMASMKIAAFTVIFLSTQSIASEKCNLYNFGMKGAFQKCGIEWWQDNDLGDIVNVTYKVSELLGNATKSVGVYESINTTLLHDKIQATSTDPFAKIVKSANPFAKMVESALVVEPFFAAIIADMVFGLEITADDMERFSLPRELANKETLIQMVKEYVDFSCTSYGVRNFTDCLSNWMLFNCGGFGSKRIYITEFLRKLDNTYCDGEVSDPEVVNIFTKDLGSMSTAIAKLFGIVRDPESPYLFNISADSILTNPQAMKQFTIINTLYSDCGFYATALTPDIMKLMQENSTVKTGAVFKSMRGILQSSIQCSIESLSRIEPELVTPSTMKKSNAVLARYGFSGLSTEFIVGKKRRHTVSVFGDPHMVIYKVFDPITCSALGWQTYLFNGFFHLQGYAELAANGSKASYVTKVRIYFMKNNEGTSYISGEGTKPANQFDLSSGQKVNKTDSMKIIEVGDGVQITLDTAGAVFAFRKYRHTYFFTLRMGEDVFDLSYGLLATGCSNSIDIPSGRRKRSTECDAACANVDRNYRDTCLFDCGVTGDVRVGEISAGIRSLEREVAEEDEKVLESLRVKSVSTPKRVDARSGAVGDGDGEGVGRNSAFRVSGHLTVMFLAAIMKLIYA